MELLVNVFEVLISDVCVYLGGGDTAVSEHALHASDIGSIH